MRLTIFSRLVIGHLSIFLLVMGVTFYAILQLRQFDDVIRSVLDIDNRAIDYEKKLTDAFLSQILYERKFTIMKDEALYDQFQRARRDFDQYLEVAILLSGSSQGHGFLSKAKEHYQRYQSLFDEEVKYLRASQGYAQGWYKQEKEKMADGVMEELKKLRAQSQQNIFDKMKRLDEAGVTAREVMIVLAGAVLILGITVSLFITRSITRPMAVLKKETREIAQGHFEGKLDLSSPPEVAELAGAFNAMCERLRAVDKMKSDFFSSMSHELRTPLTSIKEGTGLLLEGVGGDVTNKQARLLTIIAEESNRLIGLVNSLLDLSKMEAGMVTYNFERASLIPLIDGAMAGIEPLAKAKRITLEAKVGENSPMIKMDSEKILEVLRNLIGNAVKFTPESGRVSVTARLKDQKVEVSVADTGPGIPKQNLTMIFDKFQQANLGGSSQTNGTGLGLAIAKHIVNAHGGAIWAESEPGQGSAFTFVLPV